MNNPGVPSGFNSGGSFRGLARFTSALALLFATSCVYWTPMSRDNLSPSATVIPNVPMQKWDIKSCGAGSLSSVLQHHGDTTTMAEWEETLPTTRGGVMSIDLVLAARQKGFDSRLVTGDRGLIDAELRAGRPLILMLQVVQYPGSSLDFFHYIVLDGYDPVKNVYRTQFGDARPRWIPLHRLERAWKGGGNAAILIRKPDPMTESLRAAVQLEEQGKYALAADAYRTILDQNPDSPLAWTNLGNAESRLGRRVSAEDAYRKAIALDESNADALNNLAWLLFEEKRIDEAEPLARQAVAAKAPDTWTRLDTLARILAAKGDCAGAKKTFQQAIELVPEPQRADLQQAASSACKS